MDKTLLEMLKKISIDSDEGDLKKLVMDFCAAQLTGEAMFEKDYGTPEQGRLPSLLASIASMIMLEHEGVLETVTDEDEKMLERTVHSFMEKLLNGEGKDTDRIVVRAVSQIMFRSFCLGIGFYAKKLYETTSEEEVGSEGQIRISLSLREKDRTAGRLDSTESKPL